MADLYVTYSAQSSLGSVTGRSVLSNSIINTFDDVSVIEQKILADLREKEPERQFANLFLTWWTALIYTAPPSPSSGGGE